MKDKDLVLKSRREAKEILRGFYPELDWHIYIVHHIDENPLNNDLSNLKPVLTHEHRALHSVLKQVKTPRARKIVTTPMKCWYCNRELYDGKCLCGRKQSKIRKEIEPCQMQKGSN